MPPQKRTKRAKKDSTVGSPKALKEVADTMDKRKCEHAWPTPADIAKLKGKPRSQWVRPEPQTIQDIDCYFGRIPQWYIEEKLLKEPGEFLLSRGHDNKLRLSVKSNEQPDYPCVHLPIEFTQTNQVRGDRNMYYRIVNTVLQSRSLWGLIQAYRTSSCNLLSLNVKRDVELREEVIPCQGCKYIKTEYSFMFVQIRQLSEIIIGEMIYQGERSKIYKATRNIVRRGIVVDTWQRPIILKELNDYNVEVFDSIYREMHIVNTIRHEIGWDTALNVEAVVTISRPYYIAYKFCSCGSLLEYLKANSSLDFLTKAMIVQDIACTLHHCLRLNIIHCNLRAKNIFVDMKMDQTTKKEKPVYYVGGFHSAVMARSRKMDPEKSTNRRWIAPEVLTTKTLTPETDVYAFAWLIYEVFTLKMPFADIAEKDVLQNLAENPNERAELPSDMPDWLKEVVESAWNTDPAKRPKMVDIWRELRKKNKDMKKT
ncbi:Tyrosine-protein kinase FRK [Toxocara canis]|uniref:Tyrosine-protein kinase FRK n=1 Tax=Toxocara canis TaxID=6265 RepID=A0A0B2VLJ6_TOXCA|nr:Tyrosine-protein kinase FRK [Toxocara canis]